MQAYSIVISVATQRGGVMIKMTPGALGNKQFRGPQKPVHEALLAQFTFKNQTVLVSMVNLHEQLGAVSDF